MSLQDAINLYQARQARQSHPSGTFDRRGRWYPDSVEQQECCKRITSPTRRFPYSLMKHCRTACHIARLTEVDAKELRAAIRQA